MITVLKVIYEGNIMHSLWSAAIGIIIILGIWGFVILVQNAYKSKEAKEEERLAKGAKNNNRRADIALVLMLIVSFVVSLWLSMAILSHIEKYPGSILTVPINFFGRLEGSGNYVFIGSKIALDKGLFFLPFSILAIISFAVYFKYFKGKIMESKWSDFSNRCLCCGKICQETIGNTHLCEKCHGSGRRIKIAVFTMVIILAAMAIIMVFFFPENVERFFDYLDRLSRIR